jgi:hypothetical protein
MNISGYQNYRSSLLYISYIFHVFSKARDHILILNILFFNKLRQIIPEIRSERWNLLIFIFILKPTDTLYLKLKYGLSLLKIHEKYKKYIFRIIFYASLIKNDKQTKKKEKKLTFLNHFN